MDSRHLAHQFLTERGVVTLVTVDRQGYPTGRRVGFVNDDFVCWVPTPKGAVKLRQLARQPKALLLAFDPTTLKYLQVKADVTVIDDPDLVWSVRERYVEKYPRTRASLTPESRDQYVVLKLTPREVRADSIPAPGQSTCLSAADLTADTSVPH